MYQSDETNGNYLNILKLSLVLKYVVEQQLGIAGRD
jgi:hypothetical protein